MRKFKDFLLEANAKSKGSLEIADTSVDDARKHLKKISQELYDALDSTFDANYSKTQSLAKGGHTKRKDMPRITSSDVRTFQDRLKSGTIDISKPFSDSTNSSNPFPEGLKNSAANDFLEAGLEVHDGNKNDDKVKITKSKITVSDLKPIQKQIYFSESIDILKRNGLEKATKFLSTDSLFIVSADNRIIDGHHRWAASMIADTKMKVTCVIIDLPISKLLPMSLAYGDSLGNERNK